jgi:hypothetical protein
MLGRCHVLGVNLRTVPEQGEAGSVGRDSDELAGTAPTKPGATSIGYAL